MTRWFGNRCGYGIPLILKGRILHKDFIKVIGFSLNKDFASYKNNLKSHCKGDYISCD